MPRPRAYPPYRKSSSRGCDEQFRFGKAPCGHLRTVLPRHYDPANYIPCAFHMSVWNWVTTALSKQKSLERSNRIFRVWKELVHCLAATVKTMTMRKQRRRMYAWIQYAIHVGKRTSQHKITSNLYVGCNGDLFTEKIHTKCEDTKAQATNTSVAEKSLYQYSPSLHQHVNRYWVKQVEMNCAEDFWAHASLGLRRCCWR